VDLSISKIYLKNFKGYEEVTIHPNADFNIIIGENNIGKSSLFEAIHLWQKCYSIFIQANKEQFYKSANHRYLNYQELDFLRIQSQSDLFLNHRKDMQLTLTISNDGIDEYELGFKIQKPTKIEDAFVRVQLLNYDEFNRFSDDYKNITTKKDLTEVIFIYQTRPISSVNQKEPYFNAAQVKRKILRGSSQEALRNKLILKRDMISVLENSLTKILECDVEIELPKKTDASKQEYVSINVKIGDRPPKELYLQGSGFLQILEILSTIEYIDAPLKILLVDEPDSHIHSKLQVNLLKELRNHNTNQFFIISHNDQFVTSSNEGEVFFLNKENLASKILQPLDFQAFNRIKEELGGVLIPLELLSSAEYIIFVEGNDDQKYIEKIYKKYCSLYCKNNNLKKLAFFPLRGKDNILSKIEFNQRTLSELFKNKIWITLFDRDFTKIVHDTETKEALKAKMNTRSNTSSKAISHNGYCIESTMFCELDKLKITLSIFYDQDLTGFIDAWVSNIDSDLSNFRSDIFIKLNESFEGQKHNRQNLCTTILSFNDILTEWIDHRTQNANCCSQYMNKYLIEKFVRDLEVHLGFNRIIDPNRNQKTDEITSKFFNSFIDSLNDQVNYPQEFLNMINELSIQ